MVSLQLVASDVFVTMLFAICFLRCVVSGIFGAAHGFDYVFSGSIFQIFLLRCIDFGIFVAVCGIGCFRCGVCGSLLLSCFFKVFDSIFGHSPSYS